MKKGLIIAHFHRAGLLRSDTVALLNYAVDNFSKVVLISTNLQKDQLHRIPEGVDYTVRKNIGYDFYSYRQGILDLIHNDIDIAYVMNTSIVCFDISKFISNVLGATYDPTKVSGISKSLEISEHIQSYFYAMPKKVITNAMFINWWTNAAPIDNRTTVIRECEIGFSSHLIQSGIELDALHFPVNENNPTMMRWQTLFDDYGIIKIELMRNNPYGMDISRLYTLATDPKINNLINQALAN